MEVEPLPVHRHPVPKIAIVLVVALVAAGAVTWFGLYRHYAHAAALVAAGEWKWADQGINEAEPLPESMSFDLDDGMTAGVRVERPGAEYSFYVLLRNPSSVTQRVLGLRGDHDYVAEPVRVAVSTRAIHGSDFMTDPESLRFRLPQAFAPGEVRWVRITERTSKRDFSYGRAETFDDLYLRMRVGSYDVAQVVPLEMSMVLYNSRT